jgi:alkanesulfonate monooxygenase SsuD/methylene tetrahydromethanopterin reductase-like flavin-dependent oxidoreductase (luciferase family)
VRIGIQLPEVEYEIRFPDLIAIARLAEQVGFDSLWLGDHLVYELELPDGSLGQRGPWEVFTTLSALAASTERIELGPLVASTSFHAPQMLAKLATTVDAVSGGRLVLGLGAGWNQREYDAYGFPYDHRVSRFEEAFTIIRTLLRDGEIDFHGRFYTADHCVLHPRSSPHGPKLMVGSIAPRMQAITLPHVEAWNVWWSEFGNTPEGFAEIKATVDERLAAIGRTGQVEATCAVYVKLPSGTGRQMGDYPKTSEPVVGDATEIADQLRQFADAGAAEIQLVVDPIVPDSIEWLGDVLAAIGD